MSRLSVSDDDDPDHLMGIVNWEKKKSFLERVRQFVFVKHRVVTQQVATLVLLYIGNIAYTFGAEVDIVVTAMKEQTDWWSQRDSGLLIAFSSGFYAVGTFGMGIVADTVGGKITFCGALIASGILNCITALANSAIFVLSIQALNIIIGAAAWSSMTNIVSRWFGVGQLAMVFSIISTSDELGEFLVDIIEGNLLDADLIRWWGMFMVQGIFAIAVGIILIFTLKGEKPEAHENYLGNWDSDSDIAGLEDDQEQQHRQHRQHKDVDDDDDEKALEIQSEIKQSGGNEEHNLDTKVGWKDCLCIFTTDLNFWLMLGVVICLTLISEFEDWFPTFYQAVFNVSAGTASTAASWVGLGATFALVFGIFYDHLSWKADFFCMLFFNVSTLACIIFLYLYIQPVFGGSNVNVAAVFGGLYGFMSALPYYIPSAIFCVKFGGKHFSGTLYGFFDAVGYIPGILLDLWAGEITTPKGWSWMLAFLIILAELATILLACYQWLTRPLSAKDACLPGVQNSAPPSKPDTPFDDSDQDA